MRRVSSISLLIVFWLVFAAGCQQASEVTPEEPVAVDTPDNVGMPEQFDEQEVEAGQAQSVAVVDQAQTEGPAETEATEVVVPGETAEPEIRFEKIVHDYGDIGTGTKPTCEFPFKNVGKGVLLITDIVSSCGCTVAQLEKKRYEPGESGAVSVVFHADPQPGKPRKTVTVVCSDPNNPKTVLTIKANIVRKVSSDPEKLVFYLGDENDGIQEIVLTSVDGAAFSITSFRSTADAITADIDPSVEATKFVLKAKVDGEKLKSNLRGHIAMGLTHPNCPSTMIYFDVMPKYTVNPPMIILFDAAPGKPIIRKIWVLSNYKKPFEVDSTISEDGLIKETGKKEIHNGYELTVEIVPPDPDGQIEYTGTFSVKLTDGTELPIEYRVFYADTGSAELEGDQADIPTGPQ